jgi:hypothetical protein
MCKHKHTGVHTLTMAQPFQTALSHASCCSHAATIDVRLALQIVCNPSSAASCLFSFLALRFSVCCRSNSSPTSASSPAAAACARCSLTPASASCASTAAMFCAAVERSWEQAESWP